MPNKRGSRVAASRAKAQERAKKKARGTGPTTPTLQETPAELVSTVAPNEPEANAAVPAPNVPESPAAKVVNKTPVASRRERQASAMVAGASLKRELGTIGVLSATVGVALVALKFGTDLGA